MKMLKTADPSAQVPSCSMEALENALITFALQGKEAAVQEVLETWVDSKLLCCAFLSHIILKKEVNEFYVSCTEHGASSEPSLADVFRAVGIAAPVWAKTLEIVIGNTGSKTRMDCEAKNALAHLQAISDKPVVKESVRIVMYLYLPSIFFFLKAFLTEARGTTPFYFVFNICGAFVLCFADACSPSISFM